MSPAFNIPLDSEPGRRPASAVSVASAFLLSACLLPANAQSLSKPDFQQAKERISAEYKVGKEACNTFSGNAKDICVEQARAKEKIARAEIQYAYSGKPQDATRVELAKVDSVYAVAKERCDDQAGQAKDVCVSEAKAVHVKGLADARLTKKVLEATTEADEDKRDADYKVSLQKCEILAGSARSACIDAAKTRFHKS